MDELKFTLRCFAFAAALLVLSQLRTGGVTLENRVQASLVNSQVADFINKAAQGGVKLIHNTSDAVRTHLEKQKKTSSDKEVVVEEKDTEQE